MAKYLSCADTAKLIRAELKNHFPGIKFSVRSSSYAGGASISINWTDGPSESKVDDVTRFFTGTSFDGMTDSTTYHSREWQGERVHFGADYVSCYRKFSWSFVECMVNHFCKQYGIPMLEIKGKPEDARVDAWDLGYYMERELNDLLRNTDAPDVKKTNTTKKTEAKQEQVRKAAEEEARRRREQIAKEEAERKAREEQARRERERREAEERRRREQEQARTRSRVAFTTREQALSYLHLSISVRDQATIVAAFRSRVKASADGNGGYREDMDLLVKAKEMALRV